VDRVLPAVGLGVFRSAAEPIGIRNFRASVTLGRATPVRGTPLTEPAFSTPCLFQLSENEGALAANGATVTGSTAAKFSRPFLG